jgi:hypothetical protein
MRDALTLPQGQNVNIQNTNDSEMYGIVPVLVVEQLSCYLRCT